MGKLFLKGWMAMGVVVGLAALAALAACGRGTDEKLTRGGTAYLNRTQAKQKILLPDSSTVILAPGTKIGLGSRFDSGYKELSLDGEAWFDIIRAPVTLHTRDMIVDILWAGRFHAEAFRARPGEEIDLLVGRLHVQKSYHSDTDSVPELLGAGEMVMINRDIDLMEKEKLNPAELEKLKRSW